MRDRPNNHHRAAMETKLGRKLGPNELVHHADEDKANNAPANLGVKSRGKHTADHNRSRKVSKLRASLRMVARKERMY